MIDERERFEISVGRASRLVFEVGDEAAVVVEEDRLRCVFIFNHTYNLIGLRAFVKGQTPTVSGRETTTYVTGA